MTEHYIAQEVSKDCAALIIYLDPRIDRQIFNDQAQRLNVWSEQLGIPVLVLPNGADLNQLSVEQLAEHGLQRIERGTSSL